MEGGESVGAFAHFNLFPFVNWATSVSWILSNSERVDGTAFVSRTVSNKLFYHIAWFSVMSRPSNSRLSTFDQVHFRIMSKTESVTLMEDNKLKMSPSNSTVSSPVTEKTHGGFSVFDLLKSEAKRYASSE